MTIENSKRTIAAELQDLSPELLEVTTGKVECFYRYKPKKDIGRKIYRGLLEKYKHDGKAVGKNVQVLFSDDLAESGILSICQGILSVIATLEKMDANDKSAAEVLDDLVDQLLKETEHTGGKGFLVDATPYVRGAKIFQDHVYIDAATWTVSTILGLVRLHISSDNKYTLSDDRKDRLVALYKHCMRAITNSFIDATASKSKREFVSGWNFTDGCKEPSVYFTFAVSEILIDMLNTFENVIRTADVALIQDEIVAKLDKDKLLKSDLYIRHKDAIESVLTAESEKQNADMQRALDGNQFNVFSLEDRELIIEIWQKCRAIESECLKYTTEIKNNNTKVQAEQMFFDLLNDGYAPYDEKSPYHILEEKCKVSANNIWNITKEKLSNSFFASNLESTVSEEAIEASVSSDVLFNNIMIVNIIINTGLDEDAEDEINYFTINGSEEYNDKISEYDTMRDTLRLAYDNCYQFFHKLQKKEKEYKVNEYTLSFDENFIKEYDKDVKDLRKAHIRVFSLMPLLVRTKTTMVEFLIRYPQYDMQIFLEHILKYRSKTDDDTYLWLWEKDSYSASSNYYFISSLASFYDYYEEYELKFFPHAKDNRDAEEKIQKEYKETLAKEGWAIKKTVAEFDQMTEEIQKLNDEIAVLQKDIDYYKNDPVRSAATTLVSEILEKVIIDVLAKQLSATAKEIASSKKESVEKRVKEYGEDIVPLAQWESVPKAEVTGIERGISDMMAALLAERYAEAVYSVRPTKDERDKALLRLNDFDKYAKFIGRDMRQSARFHIKGLATEAKKTDFVANLGESTLPDGDHRFLVELIADKKKSKGDKT